MHKPTAFFSHSSQDKSALAKLKELFVSKTGGSIDVFLSSDGQSIPFGRNWVHSVEQALDQAKLMLVFVTVDSLRSNWLYFESGYAYSKGIRVVPVSLGVDLAAVGAPLSLLQGFNVTSEAGLNNIIAVANEVFRHSHAESFSSDDFRLISISSGATPNTALGPHVAAIDEIIIEVKEASLQGRSPASAVADVASFFASEGIEHTARDKVVKAQGMSLYAQEDVGQKVVRIELDPFVGDIAFPLIERAVRAIGLAGMQGLPVRMDFIAAIDALQEHHKLTGRLYGSQVRLVDANSLGFRSLDFSIGRLMSFSTHRARAGAVYLSIRSQAESIALSDLRELLDLLFERRALFYEDQ